MGLGFKHIEIQVEGIEADFNKRIKNLKKNLKLLQEQHGLTEAMREHDRYLISKWLSKKAKLKPTENQFRDAFERAGVFWVKDLNKELNKKISLMQLGDHINKFIEKNFENGRFIPPN